MKRNIHPKLWKIIFNTAKGFCLLSHETKRPADAGSLQCAPLTINRSQISPLRSHSSTWPGEED